MGEVVTNSAMARVSFDWFSAKKLLQFGVAYELYATVNQNGTSDPTWIRPITPLSFPPALHSELDW